MPGRIASVTASAVGVAALCVCAGSAHAAFAFEDIQLWTGAGENSAVLVIDWNDGKSAESIAWGYRWTGSATGADMVEAVIRADDRLYGAIASLSFGMVTVGLGYDLDADGFQTSPATAFDSDGFAIIAPRDGTVAADTDDHYVEGWNTGYWSYWVADDSPFGGSGLWGYADNGISIQMLAPNEWHGLSFAPGFNGPEPGEPAAAVPAPGAAALLALMGFASPRRRVR